MSYSKMVLRSYLQESTLNPFSSRLGDDVRVAPQEIDTPKTVAGRIGLNLGRYVGASQLAPIGSLGGAAAGGILGTGAGALAGVGAQALGLSPEAAQTIAGLGALGGTTAGLVKGTVYGARKGAGLGGRTARYVSTGSTKLPSEKKELEEVSPTAAGAPQSIKDILGGIGRSGAEAAGRYIGDRLSPNRPDAFFRKRMPTRKMMPPSSPSSTGGLVGRGLDTLSRNLPNMRISTSRPSGTPRTSYL